MDQNEKQEYFLKKVVEADWLLINYWAFCWGYNVTTWNNGGFLLYYRQVPVILAFLHVDGEVGYIGSLMANPYSSKEERPKYIKTMLYYLEREAKARGVRTLISTPEYNSLIQTYQVSGWNMFPNKVYYMCKEIE